MNLVPNLDPRIAANLLALLAPRIQDAQAVLEAAQALQRIVSASHPMEPEITEALGRAATQEVNHGKG